MTTAQRLIRLACVKGQEEMMLKDLELFHSLTDSFDVGQLQKGFRNIEFRKDIYTKN